MANEKRNSLKNRREGIISLHQKCNGYKRISKDLQVPRETASLHTSLNLRVQQQTYQKQKTTFLQKELDVKINKVFVPGNLSQKAHKKSI